jgi:hypothetical protein
MADATKNLAIAMEAREIQRHLRELVGHDAVSVRPRGGHFVVEVIPQQDDDDAFPIARLTKTGTNGYTAAFRNHSGRWEPLPGQGGLADMAKLVNDHLAPYLEIDNY